VSEIPDPIGERERALADMLDGRSREAAAEEARAGLEAARKRRVEDVISAPPTLGFGVIRAEAPFDGQRFLVAVTDGERDAAITITLTDTLIVELGIAGEHTSTYVIERISRAASGSFKADRRYEEVVLAHPYTFSA
jgi:hypothetical protein